MQSHTSDTVSNGAGKGEQPESAGYIPRLRKPHLLIARTTCKTHGCTRPGHVSQNDHEGADIRVSKQMFRTALSIMDIFFKELEKRDIEITNEPGYNGGTYASRGRDRIPIGLCERYKREPHVPTANEKKDASKYSWSQPPKWDFVPTGELTLSPGGAVALQDEMSVRAAVIAAVAEVESDLSREAEEAARHREWERQQRIEHERKKSESMMKSAQQLHEYQLLLQYIEEVRRLGRIPTDQVEPGQTLDQWLAWAEEKASCLHPLY